MKKGILKILGFLRFGSAGVQGRRLAGGFLFGRRRPSLAGGAWDVTVALAVGEQGSGGDSVNGDWGSGCLVRGDGARRGCLGCFGSRVVGRDGGVLVRRSLGGVHGRLRVVVAGGGGRQWGLLWPPFFPLFSAQ